MKVSATVTTGRVERNQYSIQKKIKSYGLQNDYPQKILDIIASSGTGKLCYEQYCKFVEGGGFLDQALAGAELNADKTKANTLLHKAARDLRAFNGFAMLIKYNGALEIDGYYNIPFEHCRIEIDENKKYTGRIAVHPDWTGIRGIRFNKEDIVYLPKFDPANVRADMKEAGGPREFKGQIYYFTADGDFEYPVCPFDAIITDMLTEESVSTVKYRNARYNFLPSGIIVRKGIKPITESDDDTARQNSESAEELKKLQGDSNSVKMWIVDIDSDEEKPEFIPFDGKNYDRQFELTERTVQDNIGRINMIPPILRGVDIGAGFAGDLMRNAYDYMNSVTDTERRQLESAFKDLLENWKQQFTDFTIEPLKFITTQDYDSTGDENGLGQL
jgi:hypothetical protein